MKLPNQILTALISGLLLCKLAVSAELEVPTVLVSATRSEQSTVSLPAAMATISRQAIESSGARNLSEVLRGVGAIQISDTFGDGSRASISMRGFGAESANANILVLVDGRRLNNTDIGGPDLNSVALADIERIEIVQGSAGTLYGDQAVAGVINIVTRRPDGRSGFVEAELGSFDRQGVRAGFENRLDSGFAYRVGVQARDTDNYRDQNQARYRNITLRVDQAYSNGLVFAEYQYVDDRLQTPGALFQAEVDADRRQSVADYDGDFSDTLTRVARVGINQSLSSHWSLEAEATQRTADVEFRLGFRGSPASGSNDQRRELRSINPRLIGSYELEDGEMLVTLGYDHEDTDYSLESVFGAQSNDQVAQSIYAQVVVPLSRNFNATVGARAAQVENQLDDPFSGLPADADLDDSVSAAELGLSWQALTSLRVFARLDQNYRFVKIDEQSQAGGAVLDTQTGLSKEIGAEWKHENLSAQLVVYRLDLDDEIAFEPTAGAFGANINLDRTRRTGFTLETAALVRSNLQLSFTLGRVDAEDISGAGSGRRIPMVAETTARVALDYRPAKDWNVFVETQYVGDRAMSGDFTNQLEALDAYTVVNASLGWSRGDWDLTARVNNLFNEKYSEFGALGFDSNFASVESFQPSPETNLVVTARRRF